MKRRFALLSAFLMSASAAFSFTNIVGGGTNVLFDANVTTNLDLYVGFTANSPANSVTNSAEIYVASTYVGSYTSNLTGNAIILADSNAVWSSSGSVVIGTTDSTGNKISVLSGATFAVTNDLTINAGNQLELDSDNVYVGGEMTIASGSQVTGEGLISFSSNSASRLSYDINSTVDNSIVFDGGEGDAEDLIVLSGGTFDLDADGFMGMISNRNFEILQLGASNDTWTVINSESNLLGTITQIYAGDGTNTLTFANEAGTNSYSSVTNKYHDFKQVQLTTDADVWMVDAADASAFYWVDGGTGDDVLLGSGAELTVSSNMVYRNFEAISLRNASILKTSGMQTFTGSIEITDSTYQATINGAESDLLTVTESVTFSSGTVDVVVQELDSLEKVILTAAGGLTGDIVETNFSASLLYDYSVDMGANDLTFKATSVGQSKVASSMAYAGVQSVRSLFDSMENVVMGRTQGLKGRDMTQSGATPNGPNGPGQAHYYPSLYGTQSGMNLWVQGFGSKGAFNSVGGAEGFDSDVWGSSLGLDKRFGNNLIAGLNYTYGMSTANLDGGGQLEATSYLFSLYGDYNYDNGVFIESSATYGTSSYDSQRVVADRDYRGTASYDGSQYGLRVQAGRYFDGVRWSYAPFAGLRYIAVSSDDHSESIDGGGTVEVSGDDATFVESIFGLRGRYRFGKEVGGVQLYGRAAWRHDFVGDGVSTTISDGLSTLTGSAAETAADILEFGGGLAWVPKKDVELALGYDGKGNADFIENGVYIRGVFSF